jgi:hypothetical protein
VLVQAAMGGVLVMLWTISDKGVRRAGRAVFKVDGVLEACTHFLESYMAKVVLGPLDTIIAEQSKQTADTLKDKRKLAKLQDEALQQTSAIWAPVCQTLVAMTDIVQSYMVHDAELLRVTSLCVLPFFHDAAEHLHSLQSSSIPLMQAIFAGYERHRYYPTPCICTIRSALAGYECHWRDPVLCTFCFVPKQCPESATRIA